MPKLNDTQLVLLASAAQREGGSVYPLPDNVIVTRASKACTALQKSGLVEEREVSAAACTNRSDGDLRYGLFITAAGLAAIGIEAGEGAEQAPTPVAVDRPPSKSALIVSLMQAETGATLADLISATGWLPHTTRAALTGLRKKGHSIVRGKRGTETFYRIVAA